MANLYVPLKDKVWDLFDNGGMSPSQIGKELHLPTYRAHDLIVNKWAEESEKAKAEDIAKEILNVE